MSAVCQPEIERKVEADKATRALPRNARLVGRLMVPTGECTGAVEAQRKPGKAAWRRRQLIRTMQGQSLGLSWEPGGTTEGQAAHRSNVCTLKFEKAKKRHKGSRRKGTVFGQGEQYV